MVHSIGLTQRSVLGWTDFIQYSLDDLDDLVEGSLIIYQSQLDVPHRVLVQGYPYLSQTNLMLGDT